MAITLGAIALPDTLVWEDEFSWSPVAQSTEYSLTGALIVQEATGGITLTNLRLLKTALDVAGASWTLTLHDARTFTVAVRENPLEAEPLPVYRSFFPANPTGDRWYLIRALKLQTV